MGSQKVEHRVVDLDGNLVSFHEDYVVVRTDVRVWSGTNDFGGKPKAQEGITFTHVVEKPVTSMYTSPDT